MSGSIDTSDILVVVDRGEQYNVNLQPPDQYGISIKSGDTYIVNIDLPTTTVNTNTTTYYRVSDYAITAATASFFGGLSASVNWNNVSDKPSGLLSSSQQINELANVSASFATTSSYAQTITGGRSRYVPLWTGSSGNELTSSIIYQMPKGIFIGYDTNPHTHSPEGETLAVHSGETNVKNVIYAHGTFDDDYRINVRNISSGVSASTNYKATSDVGTDVGGFVEMGINSSTYSRTDQIGGPLDAYLYTTGSDLLLGTLSPDNRVIIFTGPGDADNNARVYIDSSGSVAINTSTVDSVNPEALLVTAIAESYNLIAGKANLNNYSQLNITNLSGGSSASADVVATANNGTETSNYIDMGINSDQFGLLNGVGGPNDAYLYSTGNQLHIGNASENKHIMFFAGGLDSEANAKLTLEANNQHTLSGSLNVTGSVNVLQGVINNLTASFAMTASYVSGAISTWDALLNKPANLVSSSQQVKDFLPTGVVSSSAQATSWTVLSASFATSASWAPTILPSGTVSSSTQVDYNQIQNKPTTISTASYIEYANVANKPTLVSSSTQINTGSFSGSFTGQLLGTSSWATNAITSSFAITAVSASYVEYTNVANKPALVSASSQIQLNAITGATFSNASFLFPQNLRVDGTLTAQEIRTEYVTSSIIYESGSTKFGDSADDTHQFTGSLSVLGTISGSLVLPSGIISSSIQVVNALPTGTVSSSAQINTGSFSGSFTGTLLGTSSWASNAISASAANSITFTPATASFAVTASYVSGAASTWDDIANKPAGLVSSSAQINTGSFSGSFTGTLVGTSSWANNANTASAILGGTNRYIPLWNSSNSLTSSLLYQTGSSLLLGATEQHTPEAPDRFGVFAGITDSYNLISAHGEIDSYLQLNIKNFSSESNASSDIVATADVGTEVGGFVNLGINNSNYNIPNAVGNALDAYLYTTGSDLLIGNIANNKKIILFNGEGTALNNARVYIDSIGTVSINTGSATPGNPEALLVKAIAFSYNMITAQADINNYAQVNIINKNSGNFASSDFVATANNGNETQYYVAMGINSENFTGDVGLANDAYLYTTGSNLLLGNVSPNNKVILFAGDANTTDSAKFIINPNNQHEITGSLTVTGSITVDADVVNQLTASNAVSSSYAISASYAPTILPAGIVSSSSQINTGSFSGSFIGNLVGTGSFATSASFALTASYVSGAASTWDDIANKPIGLVSSSQQINTGSFSGSFRGTFIGDGSQLTGVVASGVGVNVTDDGIVQGNASRLDFGNFITATVASNTASINVALPVGTVSSSQQINTGSFSGSFVGILTGTATNAITASYALNGSGGGATAVTIDTYTFDADGSTVNYIVSQSYDASSLFVTVNGLGYTNGTDYTVATNTITFTNAPISASYVVIRALTNVTSGATGSFSGSFFGNIQSSSYATTASFAISASWAPSSGGTNDWNDLTNIPSGLVSSSTQATTWTVATASVATSASFTTTASAATSITFTPTTASFALTASYVSGAASTWDTISNKPAGLVSSSLQINTGSFSGSFTGNFIGTSSWANNAVTAQTASYFDGFITFPSGLDVTGSLVVTGSTMVTGSISATTGFTGSLFGTSSWASNVTSASFATTASAANSITFTPATASFAITASYVSGAVSTWDAIANKPIGLVSSSQQINTGSFSGSFRGIFVGDGSQLTGVVASGVGINIADEGVVQGNAGQLDFGNFITATVASSTTSINVALPAGTVSSSQQINTGSFSGSFTGNFIGTSSWANNSVSSSFTTTASYAVSASTVSQFDGFINFPSGLDVTGSLVVTGSTMVTGSISATNGFTGSLFGTSSWASNVISSSFATTASYAVSASTVNQFDGFVDFPNGLDITGSLTVTGSTIVTGSISATNGFTGSLFGTSSWAQSASWAPSGTATFPYNGNADITGSLRVTGSIVVTGGTITSSLFGTSSWASNVISSSFATTASYANQFEGFVNFPNGLDVTGSLVVSGSTTVTGSISATLGFTGSLLGTSSWANSASVAISSSFAPTILPSGVVSSSTQATTWTVATASVATSSSFALSASWAPSVASIMVPVQDEGTVVVSAPVALNFIGAGVTVTNTSNTASITIPGGSGGDVNAKIVSASYTFGSSNEFIFTTGSFTVTLPSAVGIIGRQYQIKNISTGVIFITGSSTIDDYSDITITEKNSSLGLISNGINWSIF